MENIEKKIESFKTIEKINNYLNKIFECISNKDKIIILNCLINKATLKYKRLSNIKKMYEEQLKTNRVFKYASEIVRLKKLIDFYDNLKDSIENKNIKKNRYFYPVLKVKYEQIKQIDLYMNINTIHLFKKLSLEDDVNKRIKILYSLKEIYLKTYVILSKKEHDINYKHVKDINRFINDAIRIEHKKKKHIYGDKLENDNDEIYKLSYIDIQIIDKINQKEKLDSFSLEDILKTYKYLIINRLNEMPTSILDTSKYLVKRIVNEEIKSDNVIILINSIKDTIKYKILYLDKDNPDEFMERSLLKEIRIVFDFICKNYKESIKNTEHDYKYDIIKYFIEDESGYPYLKKILSEIPSFVNIRINENSNEHIIINILRKYIYNYKKMLNKEKNFINPDYLRQIYLLFMNNENLKINQDDKLLINSILDEFITYIDTNIYKEDRKNLAKRDARKLKTEYLYYEKTINLRKVIPEQLVWQTDFMNFNISQTLEDENRVLIKENPITINGINAYSIIENSKEKKLRIHVIDSSKIIAPYTSVDSHVYNCMINKEKISQSINDNLTLKYDRYNPTITYELIFDKENQVQDLKIFKSKILLNKKIDEDLNKLITFLSKNIKNKNTDLDISDIDILIEHILNDKFIHYLNENNLPFIFYGKENINDYINQMNDLNNIFNRLLYDDFIKLHNIISNNVGEYTYTVNHYDIEYDCYLNLINEINYLFIFNQRFINDVIIENGITKSKDKYKKEYELLEHKLNLSINHIRPNDIVFKNKVKKNRLREFNL